jgi:hypothetical protein
LILSEEDLDSLTYDLNLGDEKEWKEYMESLKLKKNNKYFLSTM